MIREGVTSAVLTFGGRPRFFGTLPLAFFVLAVEPGWRWVDGPAAGGVYPLDDATDNLRPSDPSRLASVTAGETMFWDLRDDGRPVCDPSCATVDIV